MSKVIRTAQIATRVVTLGKAEEGLYLADEIEGEGSHIDFTALIQGRVEGLRQALVEEGDTRVREEHETMRSAAERQRQEAEERHREEVEQVHQQRYDEGHAAGVAVKEDEARAAVERLDALHESIKEERRLVLREAEVLVIDLATAMARRISRVQAETDRTVLVRVARQALEHLSEGSNLIIKVHADDLRLARRFSDKWVEKVEGDAILKVQVSEHVERGGCMIEGTDDNIDARLDQQLRVLQEELRNAVLYQDADTDTEEGAADLVGPAAEADVETDEESTDDDA